MGIRRNSRHLLARLGFLFAGIALALAMPTVALAATASFSSRTPAPGTTVLNTRPTVSVRVYGRYGFKASSAMRIYVDGVSVRVTRVLSGSQRVKLTYRPSVPLASGTHRVKVTVRDRRGYTSATSWSFSVVTPPPAQPADMPVSIESSACGTCHVGLPQQHPMTACPLCHGEGRPVPGVAYTPYSTSAHTASCAQMVCHRQDAGAFPHVLGSDCLKCHSGQYPGIGVLHGAPTAATHRSNNTYCTKSGCHDPSLTVEHYKRTADGARLTCATCHATTDAVVRAALAAGKTDCLACHTPAGAPHPGLPAAHVAAEPACTTAGCHATDLPSVHKGSCAPCHSAGTYPSARCTTCHSIDAHAALHALTRTDTCAGPACHEGSSLTALRTGGVAASAHGVCATCHSSSDARVGAAISSGDTRCGACHPGFTDHASAHLVDRSADTCSGTGCHAASNANLTTIHGSCATCHGSADPAVAGAIAAGDKACATCHGFTSHVPSHVSQIGGECVLSGCHASASVDLTVQHASCETCHQSGDPAVHAAVAAHDTRCVACHPGAGHVAEHAVQLPVVCAQCHTAPNGNLIVEHGGCDWCHGSSRQWVQDAITNKNTDCYACHAPHYAG